MNFPQKNENGFISFFALIVLMATAFFGAGLLFIMKENIKTVHHHEIAFQLRYDAESAIEKIVFDIENNNFHLPDDINDIDEYVVPNEYLFKFNEKNKSLKVSVKYENNGIRIFAISEKTDLPYTMFYAAEGFMEKYEDGYKWKYWIKVR